MAKLQHTVYLNDKLRLTIETGKAFHRQAIDSHATVGHFDFRDNGIEYWQHTFFKDYSKLVKRTLANRVTAKAKQLHHDDVLKNQLDSIIAEAKAFYNLT